MAVFMLACLVRGFNLDCNVVIGAEMFTTGEHQSAFKNSRRTVKSWAQIKMPLAFCARAQPMSAELATRSARAFLPFLPNSDLEGDNKRGSERAPKASRATGSLPQVSTHVLSTAQVLISADRPLLRLQTFM